MTETMEKLTIDTILQATAGTLITRDFEKMSRLRPKGVSIDSRTIQRGDLFFALRGERLDGHNFVAESFHGGALGAVISKQWAEENHGTLRDTWTIVVVDDTLRAFQECARFYRSLFSIPVVAVTGTNGKTTTKDMTAAVLSRTERCLKIEGNLNNHIGLPLTLFRLTSDHSAAVVELGMRASGEIARLAEVSDPQVGVITNVGPAHFQFFHSLKEIAQAKAELLDYFSPSGTAALNSDDALVMAESGRMRGNVVTFGLNPKADVRAEHIRVTSSGGIAFQTGDGLSVELLVPGRSMVHNALAAIAVGRKFDVPDKTLQEVLAGFQPQPMRMELCRVNGLRILNDAYNANPVSMREAVRTLQEFPCTGKKIAILGDMLELGEWATEAHRDLGKMIGTSDISSLLTVGTLSRFIAEEAIRAGMPPHRVHHCESRDGVVDTLLGIGGDGDCVLVKGSRKMALEEIVEGLRKRVRIEKMSREKA